jgi:phosphoribosylformylglycinamidine cyclo-ligase
MKSKYADAGVDIDKGNKIVKDITSSVRSTFRPEVLTDIGLFGGLFDISATGMQHPVLVSSIDGVGTKLNIAAALNRFIGVGHDIVAHCCDDIVVQGAQPLFFLDYVAAANLDQNVVTDIVTGIAEECCVNGCALLGGETAEMPGSYVKGQYDLVGCIVGVVDKDAVIDGSTIAPGDVAVGLPSSGLHTNGYSLARKILLQDAGLDLAETPEGCDRPLGDILLEPHRSYVPVVLELQKQISIKGIAHITGGGLVENVPRILPGNCDINIDVTSFTTQPVFSLISRLGTVSPQEMFRVFNMGVGLVIIVDRSDVEQVVAAVRAFELEAPVIGEITEGSNQVQLENLA